MKSKLHKLFILLTAVFALGLRAQDIQLTQFYSVPLFLNPALTGANACSRTSIIHRTQWPGVNNAYKTYLVSFDHSLNRYPIGLGFIAGVDEAGSGGLRTTILRPSVSYEAKVKKRHLLRFGIQPGIGIKSVDFNKLTFGDQLYRGGADVKTLETPTRSKTYFDFNAGAMYITSNYWAGISLYHLNLPNESLLENYTVTLPVEFSFHAGAKFDLTPNEKVASQKTYISPVVHYRAQRKYDQVDIGFYFTKSVFTGGLWYRGIPGLKAYNPGYSNNDAVAVIVGLQTDKIKVGYSYDLTISKLAGISKGAHEITLSFQMCNPKRRKTRHVLISCPKF
jgi:type IX secretion system PorP/SprF family membrane protein